MFNKEYMEYIMTEDKNGLYLRQIAREVPLTIDRVDRLITFICDYVSTRNKVIEKYEAEGKDITNLIADRDYALYLLGLGEKPERQAKVIL